MFVAAAAPIKQISWTVASSRRVGMVSTRPNKPGKNILKH